MQVVQGNGHHPTTHEVFHEHGRPAPEEGLPLVLVEWHDAWFDFDLGRIEDRRVDYLVRTVGFLVGDDRAFVSIAQELLPDGEGFRAVTHIPVSIIERITELAHPEPRPS